MVNTSPPIEFPMRAKLARLFTIKSRTEAFCVIYALSTGAAERGSVYLARFPGIEGKLLFGACMVSVLMAGAKILDCLRFEAGHPLPRNNPSDGNG